MPIEEPLDQYNINARECINLTVTIKKQSDAETIQRNCYWKNEVPAVLKPVESILNQITIKDPFQATFPTEHVQIKQRSSTFPGLTFHTTRRLL